jgi:hypothetical protein
MLCFYFNMGPNNSEFKFLSQKIELSANQPKMSTHDGCLFCQGNCMDSRFEPLSGPNPTTSIYNAMGILARFENINILF